MHQPFSKTDAALKPPPDWPAPRKTIIVAALPRCGSHFLTAYMQGSGVLGIGLEHFNQGQTESRRPDQDTSVLAQCRYTLEDGASPNGAVAIKLMPDHLQRAEKEIDLFAWFPQPRWLYVRRRDILAQAISFEIAMQTQAWVYDAIPEREPVYSAEGIKSRLDEIARGEAGWFRYFITHGIEPLELLYEDMIADPQRAIQRVAAFAGEPLKTKQLPRLVRALGIFQRFAPPAPVPFDETLKIQRTERNEEWRQRFLSEADKHLTLCDLSI